MCSDANDFGERLHMTDTYLEKRTEGYWHNMNQTKGNDINVNSSHWTSSCTSKKKSNKAKSHVAGEKIDKAGWYHLSELFKKMYVTGWDSKDPSNIPKGTISVVLKFHNYILFWKSDVAFHFLHQLNLKGLHVFLSSCFMFLSSTMSTSGGFFTLQVSIYYYC